jgi:hypothetical protein
MVSLAILVKSLAFDWLYKPNVISDITKILSAETVAVVAIHAATTELDMLNKFDSLSKQEKDFCLNRVITHLESAYFGYKQARSKLCKSLNIVSGLAKGDFYFKYLNYAAREMIICCMIATAHQHLDSSYLIKTHWFDLAKKSGQAKEDYENLIDFISDDEYLKKVNFAFGLLATIPGTFVILGFKFAEVTVSLLSKNISMENFGDMLDDALMLEIHKMENSFDEILIACNKMISELEP